MLKLAWQENDEETEIFVYDQIGFNLYLDFKILIKMGIVSNNFRKVDTQIVPKVEMKFQEKWNQVQICQP